MKRADIRFHKDGCFRGFFRSLHILYLFILDNDPEKDVSLKDSVLSRIFKLESNNETFIPVMNFDFFRYSMVKRQCYEAYNISEENYFIYYSPETETIFWECFRNPNCYGEFESYSFSMKKNYELSSFYGPKEEIQKDNREDFLYYSFPDQITGNYETDKKESDFYYLKDNPLIIPLGEKFINPYSFWLNFYKHYGDFNIYDFKMIIKKDAIEVHPFDDSSFDKVNDDPTLKRYLYRNLLYPIGYLRYMAYSFFSKGDEIDQSKMEKKYNSNGKLVNSLLSFELICALNDECEIKDLANAPYENPYALGDLWNLKLGTDMILYHPVLKEAALVDGWEKKIYVFKL